MKRENNNASKDEATNKGEENMMNYQKVDEMCKAIPISSEIEKVFLSDELRETIQAHFVGLVKDKILHLMKNGFEGCKTKEEVRFPVGCCYSFETFESSPLFSNEETQEDLEEKLLDVNFIRDCIQVVMTSLSRRGYSSRWLKHEKKENKVEILIDLSFPLYLY